MSLSEIVWACHGLQVSVCTQTSGSNVGVQTEPGAMAVAAARFDKDKQHLSELAEKLTQEWCVVLDTNVKKPGNEAGEFEMIKDPLSVLRRNPNLKAHARVLQARAQNHPQNQNPSHKPALLAPTIIGFTSNANKSVLGSSCCDPAPCADCQRAQSRPQRGSKIRLWFTFGDWLVQTPRNQALLPVVGTDFACSAA